MNLSFPRKSWFYAVVYSFRNISFDLFEDALALRLTIKCKLFGMGVLMASLRSSLPVGRRSQLSPLISIVLHP